MSLSKNDAKVLSSLFDPESHPSSNTTQIDTSLPSLPNISQPLFHSLQSAETAALRPLKGANPPVSAIRAALSELDSIIAAHKEYASGYVNRAMVRRLLADAESEEGAGEVAESNGDLKSTSSSSSSSSSLFSSPLLSAILADLSTAIALTTPQQQQQHPTLSRFQADLLVTAHSHMAYIYLKASELARAQETASPTTTTIDTQAQAVDSTAANAAADASPLTHLTAQQLEEKASAAFALAGRYGDGVAKGMAVRTNPYAKMCGAIVKEAIMKEREEAGMV